MRRVNYQLGGELKMRNSLLYAFALALLVVTAHASTTGSGPISTQDNTVAAAVAAAAITPPSANTAIVTGAAAATLVLKATAGNLRSAYATNLTSTAGFLLLLNSTTAPADGAVTPLGCLPLPAGGVASINFGDWAPSVYSTGITAVVSSATTCYTKTTGVITAFISGSVQ